MSAATKIEASLLTLRKVVCDLNVLIERQALLLNTAGVPSVADQFIYIALARYSPAMGGPLSAEEFQALLGDDAAWRIVTRTDAERAEIWSASLSRTNRILSDLGIRTLHVEERSGDDAVGQVESPADVRDDDLLAQPVADSAGHSRERSLIKQLEADPTQNHEIFSQQTSPLRAGQVPNTPDALAKTLGDSTDIDTPFGVSESGESTPLGSPLNLGDGR